MAKSEAKFVIWDAIGCDVDVLQRGLVPVVVTGTPSRALDPSTRAPM